MFPHFLRLGPIQIATYGVFVALAYLSAILWIKSRREKLGLTEDEVWTLIYIVFFGGVLGSKLMYIALNWRLFASGELGLIRDFRYGFVWYGGVLGGLVSGWYAAKRLNLSFAKGSDYFAVVAPVSHSIGRLGCLGAGCCYGEPTGLPWGVVYDNPASLIPEKWLGVPLHPSQLYEVGGNLLILAVVWKLLRRVEDGRLRPGIPFAVYTCLYGVMRFLVEFTRADERGGWLFGMSPAQVTAILLVSGTIALLAYLRRRPA